MSPLAARTLFDKFWDSHLIATLGDGRGLVHIDRHLLRELASPASAAAIAGCLDEIAQVLTLSDTIADFQRRDLARHPWHHLPHPAPRPLSSR